MNTTAINNTVRNILRLLPSKAKQSWDTLHHTPSGSFATVDFTTCPLTVDITDNKDIVLLKELIGDYNMSYTVCRIDMPTHKDKFLTGSYRVLLQLSNNSVKTQQAKADISVGDNVWVVQKTKRTAGVVTKVNIKKAIVDMQGSRYNVPLSMLEVQ